MKINYKNYIIEVEDAENVSKTYIKRKIVDAINALEHMKDGPIADPAEEFETGIPSTAEATALLNEIKKYNLKASKRELIETVNETLMTMKEKLRTADKYNAAFKDEERLAILKKFDSWMSWFKKLEKDEDVSEEIKDLLLKDKAQFESDLEELKSKYIVAPVKKDAMSRRVFSTGLAIPEEELNTVVRRAYSGDEDAMDDLVTVLNKYVADAEEDVNKHLFSYVEEYDKETLENIVHGYLAAEDAARKFDLTDIADILARDVSKLEKAWKLASYGEKAFQYISPRTKFEEAKEKKANAYKAFK